MWQFQYPARSICSISSILNVAIFFQSGGNIIFNHGTVRWGFRRTSSWSGGLSLCLCPRPMTPIRRRPISTRVESPRSAMWRCLMPGMMGARRISSTGSWSRRPCLETAKPTNWPVASLPGMILMMAMVMVIAWWTSDARTAGNQAN